MQGQSGILAPVPPHCRYLMFSFDADCDSATHAVEALRDLVDGEQTLVGLGPSLLQALGKDVPGMRSFPALSGPGIEVPSTQYALWFWLRGEDRGELFHRSRDIEDALAGYFQLQEALDAFVYDDSRDLSGYEDGTENPRDEDAVAAAIAQDLGPGLDGSSFVAIQQWRHEFHVLDHMESDERDNVIGRRLSDNEEFDDAPPSAHVKRTAQESYSPEAFIVRRSMPWVEGNDAGLVFVAFGKSLDAFETILKRMVGHEDGITDALFTFTRPISGGYYWCPPMKNRALDLRALVDG